MRKCCICDEFKSLSLFYKDKHTHNGYGYKCKECTKKLIYCRNKEKPEKRKEQQKKYYDNNRDIYREACMRRYASKKKATPPWLDKDDILKIKCYYQVASMRNKSTEIKWHVDHIVPLRGKQVCGLHVPWNLQVIPASDNIKKSNKHAN